MTRRPRSLLVQTLLATAGVVAGATAIWFAFIRERPEPQPEEPKPKTTAELLVGKWKMVKHNISGLPAGFQSTTEFTNDGEVMIWLNNPVEAGPQGQIGSYQLEGNTLRMTGDNWPSPDRTLTIESVTLDRLVMVFRFPRLTPEDARLMEKVRKIPAERLIAEAGEDIHVYEYERGQEK